MFMPIFELEIDQIVKLHVLVFPLLHAFIYHATQFNIIFVTTSMISDLYHKTFGNCN
jgi:hypothetical protein